MTIHLLTSNVAKQSIAMAFCSVSKFTGHLSTNSSSSFDIIFGATKLREEAFSHMKINQATEAVLTDEHIKHCVHLCLINYEASFSKLPQDMQYLAETAQ